MGAIGKTIGTIGGGMIAGPVGALVGRGLGGQLIDSQGDAPENHQVGLDSDSKGLIDQQASRANRSVDDFQKDTLNGTNQTQQLQASIGDQAQRNSALGGAQPDDLQAALNKRAGKSYGRDLDNLTKNAHYQAQADKGAQLQKASGYAASEQKALAGIAHQKQMQDENNRHMRNQVIGNLMGVAGMAGGMALGGPMAASTGQKLGQGMGGDQSIRSSDGKSLG